MIERLGHVFGWIGNILGGLLVTGGIYALTHYGNETFAVIFVIVPGVVIFLLGRALRYIFAGSVR